MELKLQISDKTAKKIKALAVLKGIDADYIGEMLGDNIDAFITAQLAVELGLDIEQLGPTESATVEFGDSSSSSDGEDMSLVPDADHGLSGEGEDVIDNTPVPESFIDPAPAAPTPQRAQPHARQQTPPPVRDTGTFGSLVDENLAHADVTDDPEEYMDEMMEFNPSQAKEAKIPATISMPLHGGGQVREATGSFQPGKPRVRVSEVQHGTA